MSNGSLKKSHSSTDLDFTLRRVFGKSSFRYSFEFQLSHFLFHPSQSLHQLNTEYDDRPYQREIITATLEGHDVFVQAGNFLTQTKSSV